MRFALTVICAAVLTASTAGAQYKTPSAPTATQAPGSVQMAPNPNIQMSMASPEDELNTARRISRDEAIKMVKQGKAVYLDVRSRETYDEGHIPGAYSTPESELFVRLKDVPPHKFLITYCA